MEFKISEKCLMSGLHREQCNSRRTRKRRRRRGATCVLVPRFLDDCICRLPFRWGNAHPHDHQTNMKNLILEKIYKCDLFIVFRNTDCRYGAQHSARECQNGCGSSKQILPNHGFLSQWTSTHIPSEQKRNMGRRKMKENTHS